MLARQEEYQLPEEPRIEDDREAMRRAVNKPIVTYVLDTTLRAHFRTLFGVAAVLAMAVAVGSGVNASRGYDLIEVQQQAAQLEQENERLRIDIAKLKSPERIKTIAQDQLGMEVPRQTYFAHEK